MTSRTWLVKYRGTLSKKTALGSGYMLSDGFVVPLHEQMLWWMSSVLCPWMQGSIEGTTGLEHPVADVQKLTHCRSDYDHLLFSSLLEPITEGLHR
jgi:hypothetical protein